MNIPLIYAQDSHGAITLDINKIDTENAVLTPSVVHPETGGHTMLLKYDNIDYNTMPGILPDNTTYKHYLTYNSTMSRTQELYTQIVSENQGVVNPAIPLEFTYDPEKVSYPIGTETDDVVLSVNFFTAEANILQTKDVPVGGNTGPFTTNTYRYSYPYSVDQLPMQAGTRTFFDGWYTSTLLVLRDVTHGMPAAKDEIYGHKGTVGKASDDGIFEVDSIGNLTIKTATGGQGTLVNFTYEEFLLKSNNLIGINTGDTGALANTQILVTDDAAHAVLEEIKNLAFTDECKDACIIADWQKMQQKRIAAYIYFLDGYYRKAQVIIESSRKTCSNVKDC